MSNKNITVPIGPYQKKDILRPVRKGQDSILILLHSLKYLTVYTEGLVDVPVGYIQISIDKRRRLFVDSEEGLFSINFPFTIDSDAEGLHFYSDSGIEVDNEMIATAISYFSNVVHISGATVWDDLELFDAKEGYSYEHWDFCKYLLLSESGYLRFDHDKENENGSAHPLNHFDVFFSQSSSIKLGLPSRIDRAEFIDILNPLTACRFLEVK